MKWFEKKYSAIVAIDFETFYGDELSLSGKNKKDYVDYVADPQFQTLCMAVAVRGVGKYIIAPQSIPTALNLLGVNDPSKKVLVVTHNARFDMTILANKYGVSNVDSFDTMLAARALGVAHLVGASLDALSLFNLGVHKDLTPAWEHLQAHKNSSAAENILLGVWEKIRAKDYAASKSTNGAEPYLQDLEQKIPQEIKDYFVGKYGSALWQARRYAVATTSVVAAMKNKTLADLNDDELKLYHRYALQDATSTLALAELYLDKLPQREVAMINISINMYTQPTLMLDAEVLERGLKNLDVLRTSRIAALRDKLGVTDDLPTIMRSAKSFIELVYPLLGVAIPPMHEPAYAKNPYNKKTEGEAYALWDGALKQHKENTRIAHMESINKACEEKNIPSPVVTNAKGNLGFSVGKTSAIVKYLLSNFSEAGLFAELAQVKLDCASSMAKTRMETFLKKANNYTHIAIPLEYASAHTGRYGGADKLNVQNLPARGDLTLRRAIIAPPWHKVISCDSAQIEARCLAYAANEVQLLNIFKRKEDPYIFMAAAIYNKSYAEIYAAYKADCPEAKAMRDNGKRAQLACGYGMGAATFAARSADSGDVLGATPEAHMAMAQLIVDAYRNTNKNIVSFWRQCDKAMKDLLNGANTQLGGPDNALINFEWADVFGARVASIRLPGYTMYYPWLRMGAEGLEYGRRQSTSTIMWVRLYGGILAENIIQSLAFCIIKEQAIVMDKVSKVALNVHDEEVTVASDADAQRVADTWVKIMSTPPAWAADIPLAATATIGTNFAGDNE